MKIFYTDHYVLPLPPWHRFPMQKYALLRERVEQARLAGRAGVQCRRRRLTSSCCTRTRATIWSA